MYAFVYQLELMHFSIAHYSIATTLAPLIAANNLLIIDSVGQLAARSKKRCN